MGCGIQASWPGEEMEEGELEKEVGGDIGSDDGGVASDELVELGDGETCTTTEEVEIGRAHV